MASDIEEIMRHPVFLVGAERSGTTLLRLMLDHHPEIAFNPEFEYAVEMIGDNGTFPEPAAYRHWLSRQWLFQDAHYAVDESLDFPDLVNSFLRQKLEQGGSGKRLLGATVHHHFNRLKHVWPNARYIHIVRDPRDVARSVMGMGWAGNIWAGLDRWLDAERLWADMASGLDQSRYINVKYEDLIENPGSQLEAICGFMGAPFHDAMFSYADKSTYDLPDPKLVYQWRKKLKDEDIQLVEARLGSMLVERGYALSGLPRIEATPQKIAALEADNRKKCRQFRIRRYGLPLLILARLTRGLPFSFPRDWFQRKLDNIDRQYVK